VRFRCSSAASVWSGVLETLAARRMHQSCVDEAADVWAAWEPHHATIRGWIERSLGGG
jgi:hypothetical protein